MIAIKGKRDIPRPSEGVESESIVTPSPRMFDLRFQISMMALRWRKMRSVAGRPSSCQAGGGWSMFLSGWLSLVLVSRDEAAEDRRPVRAAQPPWSQITPMGQSNCRTLHDAGVP